MWTCCEICDFTWFSHYRAHDFLMFLTFFSKSRFPVYANPAPAKSTSLTRFRVLSVIRTSPHLPERPSPQTPHLFCLKEAEVNFSHAVPRSSRYPQSSTSQFLKLCLKNINSFNSWKLCGKGFHRWPSTTWQFPARSTNLGFEIKTGKSNVAELNAAIEDETPGGVLNA